MFKQVSLAVASVMVLSACASTDVNESSLEMSTANEMSSVDGRNVGMMDSAIDVETKELRDDLAAQAGDRVFFDFDSASLTAEARTTLNAIADYVISSDAVESVTIEGHCDERGTREYNLALGDRRAVSIKKYLVGLGVDASKIATISYGKDKPAYQGHTADVWAKNRRGVVVLN